MILKRLQGSNQSLLKFLERFYPEVRVKQKLKEQDYAVEIDTEVVEFEQVTQFCNENNLTLSDMETKD